MARVASSFVISYPARQTLLLLILFLACAALYHVKRLHANNYFSTNVFLRLQGVLQQALWLLPETNTLSGNKFNI